MTRPRRVPAATLLVLAAVSATAGACGGGGADDPYAVPDRFRDYCEEIGSQRGRISEALESGGEATGLIRALPGFEALAAKAPDDIADDWALVIDRVTDLVDALEAVGVDPETYDRRNPPAGLDREQRDRIDAAAADLVSRQTAEAMSNVQQQARDVCKTQLVR